jgi:hypothetical protein
MAKRKARTRIISVRLYPGQDDALIAWHDSLASQPFGAKSQGIKSALLRGIGGDAVSASSPSVDVGALLSDIRKVVEAAAMQALAGSGVTPAASPQNRDEAEEGVAGAMLDELADNLLM